MLRWRCPCGTAKLSTVCSLSILVAIIFLLGSGYVGLSLDAYDRYLPLALQQNSNDTAGLDAQKCVLVSPSRLGGYTMLQLLRSWPERKPRAFIYFLAKSSEIAYLRPLLRSIDDNFNRRFRYPIVVFCDSKDAARVLRRALSSFILSEYNGSPVFVYDITSYWQVPQFILERHGNSTENLTNFSYQTIMASGCRAPGNLGYWLMCRFHSKVITEIPFVQAFEYIWRLDTDSKLCGPIELDLFSYMKKNDYWDGYLLEAEYDSCAGALTEHVQEFTKMYHITPAQGNESIADSRVNYIYNNFEIFKVQFFSSPEYRLLMNFTEASGGYYYYRWGDAPLRTQAMRLFMPKEKMIRFNGTDVKYKHQTFNQC